MSSCPANRGEKKERNLSEQLRLRREGLTWQAVEGEVVALDVEASVYLAANHTGAMLWSMLAEGTTREALVSLLVEAFNLPVETAHADVARFLNQLGERRLLE